MYTVQSFLLFYTQNQCFENFFISRVVEMYQEVGEILAKYRSGKVPKAFKVIAQFRNWEDLLILTKPENWSAAAVYQATRIFTANLKEKFA